MQTSLMQSACASAHVISKRRIAAPGARRSPPPTPPDGCQEQCISYCHLRGNGHNREAVMQRFKRVLILLAAALGLATCSSLQTSQAGD